MCGNMDTQCLLFQLVGIDFSSAFSAADLCSQCCRYVKLAHYNIQYMHLVRHFDMVTIPYILGGLYFANFTNFLLFMKIFKQILDIQHATFTL